MIPGSWVRLRLKALRQLVDDWEAEHGAISTAELEALENKVAAARRTATMRLSRSQMPGPRQHAAS